MKKERTNLSSVYIIFKIHYYIQFSILLVYTILLVKVNYKILRVISLFKKGVLSSFIMPGVSRVSKRASIIPRGHIKNLDHPT